MSEGKFKKWWHDHGSTVLTITGVLSCIATPILSATATPKAIAAVKEAEAKKYEEYLADVDPDEGIEYQPLTKWEKFKAAWKHYIPTGISAGIGIGSIIGAHATDQNVINNISTAYNVLNASSQLFEKKVAENVSPDKLNKIRSEVAKEQVKELPPPQLYLEDGDDKIAWFKDDFSKRYFRATTVQLDKVKNEVNNTMLNEGFISLNEWYIMLGMDPIELGWDIGWHATIPGELMDFHIEYAALEDGTPCGLLVFSPQPGPKKGTYI